MSDPCVACCTPRFLLLHAKVLAIGTILVMALKALLVAATVAWFG